MATFDERNNFSNSIIEHAKEYGISHIDAFIDYCAKTEVEMELAVTLVNQVLKDYLEEEGKLLHLLKRSEEGTLQL